MPVGNNRITCNQRVVGSSPTSGALKKPPCGAFLLAPTLTRTPAEGGLFDDGRPGTQAKLGWSS